MMNPHTKLLYWFLLSYVYVYIYMSYIHTCVYIERDIYSIMYI